MSTEKPKGKFSLEFVDFLLSKGFTHSAPYETGMYNKFLNDGTVLYVDMYGTELVKVYTLDTCIQYLGYEDLAERAIDRMLLYGLPN